MKIGEITQKVPIERTGEVPKDKRTAGSCDFRSLFEGELSSLAEAAERSSTLGESAAAVGGGLELPSVWHAGMPWNDAGDAASAARGIGEKLEQMGRLMGDGRASLKQIDETLDALTREADNLREKAKVLPEDHPLRDVSEELSVLAYVESVKWKRGDYL